MNVIGICASARPDGNTALLMRRVFTPLEAQGIGTELIQLAGRRVDPCRACGGRGVCANREDEFYAVFEKMKGADGILLGSPVYCANVSARMPAFLERAAVICDGNPGLLRDKVGAAVTAARRGGALQALDSMNHFS